MIRIAVLITVVLLGFLEAKPTWHKIVVNPQMAFGSIVFVDYLNGWATGRYYSDDSQRIFHTTDVGRTWTQQFTKQGARFNDIDFCDTMVGWVVGGLAWSVYLDYLQVTTSNGGSLWLIHPPNLQTNLHAYQWLGCMLVSSTVGWCAGYEWESTQGTYGVIAHWQSGGQHSFPNDRFFDIDAVDSLRAWGVGENRDAEALVVRTTDGGRTWSRQTVDSAGGIRGIDFLDLDFGIAVAGNAILRTTNGGTDWIRTTTAMSLTRVEAVDTLQVWIVGARGTILHTTDCGSTWFRDSSGTTVNLSGVSFVDSTHGWAVGDSGVVLIYCDSLTTVQEPNTARPDRPSLSIRPLSNPTRKPVFICHLPCRNPQATVTIYDCQGNVVRQARLDNAQGRGLFVWDKLDSEARGVCAGIYFVRVKAGALSQTAKVILID